jgi:hypothetical protein
MNIQPEQVDYEKLRLWQAQLTESVLTKNTLSATELKAIIDAIIPLSKEILFEKKNVYRIPDDKNLELVVFGDIHGQVDPFGAFGLITPNPLLHVIFMGDIVDRGPHSLEVLLWILIWQILYPEFVHILRGNHEDIEICQQFGFYDEINRKLPDHPAIDYFDTRVDYFETRDAARDSIVRYWYMLTDFFAFLPIAVISKRIYFTHASIPPSGVTIAEINQYDRTQLVSVAGPTTSEQQLIGQMLWGDPRSYSGPSARGANTTYFSPADTERFLGQEDLDLVIRAHEAQQNGWSVNHRNKDGKPITITVFSASIYCGRGSNKGAIAFINRNGEPQYCEYTNASTVTGSLDAFMQLMQAVDESTEDMREDIDEACTPRGHY